MGSRGTSLELAFGLSFPEVSTAAWRVAQVSQAAPYIDYDWLVQRARQYDALERLSGLPRQVIAAVGDVVAATGDDDEDVDDAIVALRQVYGRLGILLQLHASLREEMATYLRETHRLP